MESSNGNTSFVADIDDFDFPETKSELEFNVSDAETETLEYKCVPVSDKDFDMARMADYVLSGIIGMPIAFLGLVINGICLFILLKTRMRKVLFNQVFNLILLFCLCHFSLGALVINFFTVVNIAVEL